MPLLLSEEVAERVDSASRRSHGVERAEIHHVDGLLDRQVRTWQTSVQPVADGRSKDVGPSTLGVVGNVTIWAVLEVRTEVMVERIIHAVGLGDDNDVVRVRRVAMRSSTPVCKLCGMEALGEVLCGLDNARLAGRPEEGRRLRRKSLVATVELDAGVNHLLLAKDGELISAQRVRVVRQKGVRSSEGLDIGVDLLDGGIVCLRLARCRIASTMP